MNVVVYVSDALRTDHLGCYGARYVNTKTIDELAASGRPLLARDLGGTVDRAFDHVDRHGDVRAPPRLPALGRARSILRIETWFRAFSAHGYEVASFVFDTNYLFKDLPEANVRGTSESLDSAFAWIRANRDTPFFLYVHNWATHMPYDIVHADRKNWLAAKAEVIAGIQSDSASALESMREGYRTAVERQSEGPSKTNLNQRQQPGLLAPSPSWGSR